MEQWQQLNQRQQTYLCTLTQEEHAPIVAQVFF
jgi:hypothetical protein